MAGRRNTCKFRKLKHQNDRLAEMYGLWAIVIIGFKNTVRLRRLHGAEYAATSKSLSLRPKIGLAATLNGNTPPIIDAEQIVFNGSPESEGYEDFEMHRVPENEFNFCKTAGMPYDEVVCAVLAVAAEHAPSAIRVQSDGPAENWGAPVGWASEVLERPVPNPISWYALAQFQPWNGCKRVRRRMPKLRLRIARLLLPPPRNALHPLPE